MITGGRGTGSGKYSYHSRSCGPRDVMVSHMPDDGFSIRIAFRHNGETAIPIIKIGDSDAEMLWACLNSMAKDLGWKDYDSSSSA